MKGNQTQSLFWKPGVVDICLLALLGSKLTPIYAHKVFLLYLTKKKAEPFLVWQHISSLLLFKEPAGLSLVFSAISRAQELISAVTNRNCCSNLEFWFIEAAYLGCPDGKKGALWCLRANLSHPGDLGDGLRRGILQPPERGWQQLGSLEGAEVKKTKQEMGVLIRRNGHKCGFYLQEPLGLTCSFCPENKKLLIPA